MKITTYERSTEVEINENSFNVGRIDLDGFFRSLRQFPTTGVDLKASGADYSRDLQSKVLAALHAASDTTLHASAEDEREITGEELYAVLGGIEGSKVVVERDSDGLISSLHASVVLPVPGLIPSLEAAPAPSKLIGDLAQTSVGATGAETQVLGLAEWTIDWKRKTADATTTDDDTYESSLGSTASWSVKAKYMFIDGDASQSANILATITSPQSPQVWNFFPTIAAGRAAFSGKAYVDGITISSGMGKVVGLDISLKGTGQLNFLQQIAPVANSGTGTGQTAEV